MPESKPSQSDIDFEPKYETHDGVKHEFTGLLYVPAPGESERLEREKPPETNPICIATPVPLVPKGSHYQGFTGNETAGKKVKMRMLDALKLRSLQPPRG
jgi:hypothetical protein